jgi:hypothetical protein
MGPRPMDEPFLFRGQVRLLTRNWKVFLASFGAGLAGMGAFALAGRTSGTIGAFLGVFGILAIFASPFVVAYTWFASPRPVLRPGDVIAGPPGVAFRGRLILPRRSIRAGFTIPHEQGVLVQLERRFFRPVELLLPSAGEARALLKSLGLDASQTAVSVPLRSLAAIDWRRFIPGFSLVMLVVGTALTQALTGSGAASLVIAALSVLSLFTGSTLQSLKARALVAADGVLVSFLWERRFYPYADIARVVPTQLGYKTVALVMKDGRSVHLPIPRYWSHAQEIADAQRLAARIQTAMSDHRAAPGEADLQALARRGRPVKDWIVHLLGVGAGANADHRRAPMPPERLWRIVESPTEDPEARAAAAVALSGAKDDPTRKRLRAVASNTAAPRLRIALEAAAKAAEEEAEAEAEVAAALDAVGSSKT